MAEKRTRVLVGVVVAVVLLAAVAVGIVLLSRGGDGVTLPDEVDGLVAQDADASVPADVESREDVLERQRGAREYASEQYAEAFDGADADVRVYGDVDDGEAPRYSVVAIEAEAGPLLPDYPFDDPEATQLAAPLVERVEEGEAECLLRRSPAPEGADAEQLAPVAVVCQRTSGALTVRVAASAEPTVEATADFLDAVWSELG